MTKSYRITKYDPLMRKANGRFPIDTWTSASDIGKVYEGARFTLADYLKIEDGYVLCVNKILSFVNDVSLVISEFEDYRDKSPANYHKVFNDELYGLTFKKNNIILGDLDALIRLSLREEVWCKLECPEAFIHFGYDFYCYVGVPDYVDVSEMQLPDGIYIEEVKSPYL